MRLPPWVRCVCAAGLCAAAAAQAPCPPARHDLMHFEAAGGPRQAVRTPADWAQRREAIRSAMLRVMGPMPGADRRVPPALEVLDTADCGAYVRRKISFAVEPGDRLRAWLCVPKGLAGRAPAVLCLHPTGNDGKDIVVGLSAAENRHYGAELAERGYVTLSPDYVNMGECRIDPYAMGYASATAKGLWNHMRCLDLLASLPEVDPGRLGCIGHSLGGHNALFLGLFDERPKALVSSCGFTCFGHYYGGDLTGWSHKGYMPRIAAEYGNDPRKMPFDFPEILAALAPRHVFVNAPLHDANFDVTGVRLCVDLARPVFALHGAADALVAMHPDCAHDFPADIRAQAYAHIDRALKP